MPCVGTSMIDALHYLTIAEASRRIAAGDQSPVDLVRAFLDRIEALDPSLRSFILVRPDDAMAEARKAEDEIVAGRWRGPLHGIPVGLKDIYETKGVPTTGCSRLLKDHVPGEDSFAWARLKDAGAILLGKHENPEFACGGPAEDGLFPYARNPWDTKRYAGGSSSGSGVAVAAGLCMAAMGSDTGGSIRVPASLCGIAGLKPSYGRVSRRGVFPLSFSLDCCGPMARTTEDCAILLAAAAGYDALDPSSVNLPVPDYREHLTEDLEGLRVGFVRHFSHTDAPVSDDINSALYDAIGVFKGLGAKVFDVVLPPLWDFNAVLTTIIRAEGFAVHERDLRERPHLYTDYARGRLMLGAFVPSADYLQAQRVRRQLVEDYNAVFRSVDVLVCAGILRTAGLMSTVSAAHKFVFLREPVITGPFSVVGAPSMSVNCGFDDQGLPIGMQIAGKPFDEATVLRAAHGYERATPWCDRRPLL